jgi:hypothetical protein
MIATVQGASYNTHLEQSKEFLQYTLVFIQFNPFYSYCTIYLLTYFMEQSPS